jgi:hypothetical protein
MSARSPGDVPPAPASSPRGISNRQFFVMVLPAVVLAVFAAVAILPVAIDPVSIQLVPPDAVQVSASADHGRTLVTHEITDARTVADLYARLNGLPVPAGRVFVGSTLCGLPDPADYTFHFTRWGVSVEDATLGESGCPRPLAWRVSRYGFWDLHMDLTGEQTQAMLAEAQLPPLPSQP